MELQFKRLSYQGQVKVTPPYAAWIDLLDRMGVETLDTGQVFPRYFLFAPNDKTPSQCN